MVLAKLTLIVIFTAPLIAITKTSADVLKIGADKRFSQVTNHELKDKVDKMDVDKGEESEDEDEDDDDDSDDGDDDDDEYDDDSYIDTLLKGYNKKNQSSNKDHMEVVYYWQPSDKNGYRFDHRNEHKHQDKEDLMDIDDELLEKSDEETESDFGSEVMSEDSQNDKQ